MKKLATLILAAGLVFGASTGASAIDFKAKGWWVVNFDYGQNGNFQGKYNGHQKTGWGKSNEDDFEASQRIRLQLDAVASESLSGTVQFEIGTQRWGKQDQGGALGTDGIQVKVRHAFLDWMVPETDVKVRMGLQNVTLPSYTTGGSTVMADDVAGIVANMKINDMIGVTAMWMRPYNDNYSDAQFSTRNSFMDNFDLGALLVPMTFDGAKVTPWGMYGAIGPNTWRKVTKNDNDGVVTYTNKYFDKDTFGSSSGARVRGGLFPVAGARHRDFSPASNARKLNSYANAWWGGITGDITMWDPFRIAWDFTYGSVTWDDDGRLNRQGWLVNLLLEYKMDWATPGLYGWYASGDDSNPANGSERMPTISDNNTNDFSNFMFSGAPQIARDGVISKGSLSGTWGIGARLKDMSFIEDLKHTFRVNLVGGTNSPTMAKKMSRAGMWANGDGVTDGLGFDGMYLTTEDYALEFGLQNVYQMYENLKVYLDANYVAMWLDTSKSVWGARHTQGRSIPQTKDAWNINAMFIYSF